MLVRDDQIFHVQAKRVGKLLNGFGVSGSSRQDSRVCRRVKADDCTQLGLRQSSLGSGLFERRDIVCEGLDHVDRITMLIITVKHFLAFIPLFLVMS